MTCEEIRKFRNENNEFAKYLGIVTTKIQPGYAIGEMPVQKHHQNAIESVHGGCLFALADTIGGAAAASRGDRMTTVSGSFHYLLPAIDCNVLIAAAQETKYGKKLAVYEVEISDEQERLIAKGTFTYFNLGELVIKQ